MYSLSYTSLLHKAIESNRPDKAARAIKRGANVDHKDETSGMTRLIQASRDSHESVLELLLASGANVNKKDSKLRGPLHHACASNQAEAALILLKHGAYVDAKDIFGRSALMDACEVKHLRVASTLMCFQCNVNSKDLHGKFPLLLACEDEGNLELIKMLIRAGADVKMASTDGRTALHEAAMKSELDVVEFLVEQGVHIGAFTIRGETALDLACAWKNDRAKTYLSGFEHLDQQDVLSPQP